MPALPNDPLSATIANPRALFFSIINSSLYFTEPSRGRILQLNTQSNTLSVIAGSGAGYVDNVPMGQALFRSPVSLWVDDALNMFVADNGNCAIRRISLANDNVITVAGNGNCSLATEPVTDVVASQTMISSPTAVTGDNQGNIYFFTSYSQSGYAIVDVENSRILKRFVGGPNNTEIRPGGSPFSIRLGSVLACLYNSSSQTLTFADTTHNMLWQVKNPLSFGNSSLSLYGGFIYGVTCPHNSQLFTGSLSIVIDSSDDLFVADTGKFRISKVNGTGIHMYAGTGTQVYLVEVSNTLRPKEDLVLNAPSVIAGLLDTAAPLYVAESNHYRIYSIDKSTGLAKSVTKTGPYTSCAPANYEGSATAHHFCSITSMALDSSSGVMYFADESFTVRVMNMSTANNWVSPFAGNGQSSGYFYSAAGKLNANIGSIPALMRSFFYGGVLMYSEVADSILVGNFTGTSIFRLVGNGTNGNPVDGAPGNASSITSIRGLCSPNVLGSDFYFTQENCKIMMFYS
eukprot:gene30635-37015_t